MHIHFMTKGSAKVLIRLKISLKLPFLIVWIKNSDKLFVAISGLLGSRGI